MRKIYIILLGLSLLVLGACSSGIEQNKTKQVSNSINTKKQVNKVKFIGFVSTWCSYCKKQVPILENIAENTSGQVEINILDRKPFPGVKKLEQEYKNPKSYEDYTHEKCASLPSYVIVDQNGKVLDKKCGGFIDAKQLKTKLSNLK